jgi:hypothetical protein
LARFLAVVGPSGSGKSSVVRAGLIPALRQGGLPNSDRWFVVEMLPGTHPWEELEAALLRIAVNPPDSLLAQLRQDERGLLRAVRRVLPADEAIELVLVIDQFEELFTLTTDEDSRRRFLDSLVTAVLDPRSRLRLVITLRADFMDRPLQYVEFGELLRQRTEFVLPLASEELEQAITTAQLWDTHTFELARRFEAADILMAAAYAPDGKTIVTNGVDKMAELWDAETGQKLRQFIGHTDTVYEANFSPDGKYVVTASADKTARLWEVATGREVRRFIGHKGVVNTAVFSPDSRTIVTGSSDRTVRIWDADYHDTIAYVCSRLPRDFTDKEREQFGSMDQTPACPP